MQSDNTTAEPQPGMRQQPDPLPVSCAPRAKAVLEYWWVLQCVCAVAACSCSMCHRHHASSVMCHGDCRRFGEAFVSAPFGYMPEQRYFGLWYKGGPDVDAEIKQVWAKALPMCHGNKRPASPRPLVVITLPAAETACIVPACQPERLLCVIAALRQRPEGARGRQTATVGPTVRAPGRHSARRPVHEVHALRAGCLPQVLSARWHMRLNTLMTRSRSLHGGQSSYTGMCTAARRRCSHRTHLRLSSSTDCW